MIWRRASGVGSQTWIVKSPAPATVPFFPLWLIFLFSVKLTKKTYYHARTICRRGTKAELFTRRLAGLSFCAAWPAPPEGRLLSTGGLAP